jgi:protein-tyrosine phosphatase
VLSVGEVCGDAIIPAGECRSISHKNMKVGDADMSQEEEQTRFLAWDACYNAREVGGYPTGDGRTTRWQALVRTDNLYQLTAEGQAALRDYGVRTVIDLRSAHELKQEANPFAGQDDGGRGPRYVNLQLLDLDNPEARATLDAAKSMQEEYCIILERNRGRIGAVINMVAEGLEEGGVVIHCHGGKDRTGIVVALLLSLAGVPPETIAEDYALSEALLEPRHLQWLEEQKQANGEPVERPRWMHSQPETMLGALEYVDQEYGGVEGYLEAAGVTWGAMERIRRHLIEGGEHGGAELPA